MEEKVLEQHDCTRRRLPAPTKSRPSRRPKAKIGADAAVEQAISVVRRASLDIGLGLHKDNMARAGSHRLFRLGPPMHSHDSSTLSLRRLNNLITVNLL